MKVSYSKGKGRIKDRKFMIGMTLFMGMGFVAIALGGWSIWGAVETKGWPTTDGIVLHTEIVEVQGGKGSSYEPIVVYQYSVDDHEYTCSNIHHTRVSSEYGWAVDQINDYPEGSSVTVHYDPENPSDAVLTTDVEILDAVPLILGIVFVTIASLLLWKFR